MSPATEVKYKDKRPSTKQVYLICRLVCKKADVEFPRDREKASQLIGSLKKEVDLDE